MALQGPGSRKHVVNPPFDQLRVDASGRVPSRKVDAEANAGFRIERG